MKQPSASLHLAAIKWALAMSILGFSYALLTSSSSTAWATASSGASPRVLTNDDTRPPTEFVTGSDLGAVIVGTTFTRQILVRFGFKPHTFRFGQFSSGGGMLSISPAGQVKGIVSMPGVETFQVNVSDAIPGVPQQPLTGTFSVNAVAQQYNEAPLHFETGTRVNFGTISQTITLPTAVSGDSYFYSFAANGGAPPYSFALIEQNSGRFLPQGLAVDFIKGVLYGIPAAPTLPNQPAPIDILLSDSTGAQVTGHFSLNILQGTITSQAVATAGGLYLNFGNNHLFDAVSLTLALDKSELNAMNIRSKSDLNGLPIQLIFGGVTLPPVAQPKSNTKIINTFDSNGQISVPKHFYVLGDVVGSNVKDVIYTIKLDPVSGILKATFQNLNLIKTIGANFRAFEGFDDPKNRGPVIPINVRIGLTASADLTNSSKNVIDKTDIIKFVYTRRGGIGRGTARLNANLAPAGIFLINRVKGVEQQVVTDPVNNITEDRIFLKITGLLRQPGAQPMIPKTGDRVSVFINRLNLGVFPASSFAVKGDQLIFTNDDPTKGLKDLVIDNKKGTVLITTHGLDPNDKLFGVDILVAGDPETVPITLTVSGNDPRNPTFDGQSTVTLFRRGSTISNR